MRPTTPAKGDYPLDSHPELPTVLIYARHDEFFEPDWERFMARELLGVEPIELPTGHFPMLEDPDALATYTNFPTTEYLELPFLDLERKRE